MINKKKKKFGSFIVELSEEKRALGKKRCAETYLSALRSFMRFCPEDICLDKVDCSLMIEYEESLFEKGLSSNSSSFYMRNLRAAYNEAVERGYTEQRMPFKKVYTGIAKTAKRAISSREIHRIGKLNLRGNKDLEFTRDIFMFSFYTRGMSFIDIAYLQKSDVSNGFLKYRRRKTNQTLVIKWEPQMRRIANKWSDKESQFLFPIITEGGGDPRRQYLRSAQKVNRLLKVIGAKAHIHSPLTMYVARHSWASIAHAQNIPMSIISEGMGHDTETTTSIYLSTLDNGALDKANRKIMSTVNNSL